MARLRAQSRNAHRALAIVARRSLALGAAAAVLVGAFGTSTASAFEIKRTTEGKVVHWNEASVDYALSPSLDDNVTGAREAVQAALGAWSGDVGAPEMRAAATESAPTRPGFDGTNGVFFAKGGYAPAGRALAITVLTYDNASGDILDADVIVNGSYSFAVLNAEVSETRPSDDAPSTAHPSSTDGVTHGDHAAASLDKLYDLHHVVAHELGHSLGMNDEVARKDALMYRYTAPNDASLREPTADDVAGLAELYGTKLEARGNGCSGATVSSKKPSKSANEAAMLAVFALVAFLMLRARTDKRARLAFLLAVAGAGLAWLPSPSSDGVARAATPGALSAHLGDARAQVLSTSTTIEDGLFRTTYRLATTACRSAACPKVALGAAWGGVVGDLRQDVGGQYAPAPGDQVDVSFAEVDTSRLAPLSRPLAGRPSADSASEAHVSVLTLARE